MLVLLRENTRLKKELDEVKKAPFDQFGLNSSVTEIKLKSRSGMSADLVNKAKDVLSDALILRKASLNEVSDLIVNEMKQQSGQSEWLCNISLEDSESSLRHNFTNASSVSFSFSDSKQTYKARIINLNSAPTQKTATSPATAFVE